MTSELKSHQHDQMETNRKRWDELVAVHFQSEFYAVEAFKAGKSTLDPMDIEEVGAVAGKTLLHLQCHFGMDTLSWARLGARVTGVDFSPPAIELARTLAADLKLDAQFVCSNIYDLPKNLAGQFDSVYTLGGVLTWLPNLKGWGQVIAHFLKPGGVFYIREGHPFGYVFDDFGTGELRVHYPYFESETPVVDERDGSYANREAQVRNRRTFEWMHSLSEIVNALIDAGLRLEFLHEFPTVGWQMLPFMEVAGVGQWGLPAHMPQLPFTFSIKATRR